MSAPANHSKDHAEPAKDGIDAIVHLMPVMLPVAGAVLIFLLAFIAVFLA